MEAPAGQGNGPADRNHKAGPDTDDGRHLDFISSKLKIERYQPDKHPCDPNLRSLLSSELSEKLRVVPLQLTGKLLLVAMADPINIKVLDRIEGLTKLDVEPVICSEQDLNHLAQIVYGMTFNFAEMAGTEDGDGDVVNEGRGEELMLGSLQDMAQEAPVVRMVNSILMQAAKAKASDIHISPEKDRVQLRFRIDGVLTEVPSPPKSYFMPLISRLKLLANMDIAVTRAPQDGRLTFRTGDQEISVRASALPTIYGENMVLRLLRQSAKGLSLDDLGMEAREKGKFEAAVQKPWGMILATGPTGSGKSTLLYSLLRKINTPDINIITLEDPVEYRMAGVRQVQLNRKAGMTFASGLRSVLRQDPDVVMIGEIRDNETAEIAIEAALTGHLVLSTLHTNSAAGAIVRFIQMGIEPYLVASTLLVAGAQRLVRRVCPNCGEPYEPPVEGLRTLGIEPTGAETFRRGRGCVQCNNTGYQGRCGVYEILEVNDTIQDMVVAGASSNEITRAAEEAGILRTLRKDAASKVVKGITTLEEAIATVMV